MLSNRLNLQGAVQVLDVSIASTVLQYVEHQAERELTDDFHGEIMPPVVQVADLTRRTLASDIIHTCLNLLGDSLAHIR